MKVAFARPRPELGAHVEAVWIFESDSGLPPEDRTVSAPNGCARLIIPYENSMISTANGQVEEGREKGVYFVGVRDGPAFLRTQPKKTGIVGIDFHPCGAFPIFGVPMAETTNRHLAVDALLGKWGRQVMDKVHDLKGADEKVDFIQTQLLRLLQRNKEQNPVVEFCVAALRASSGRTSVSDLEQTTGYSRRYLGLLFKHHVGVAPKTIAEIFRFQKFYQIWAQKRPYDAFAQEIYDHYHDQSHFTKEFKRMTGFPPLRFSRGVTNEFGRRLSLR
ncbi:AraC family transcriptional regulator [Bradyrhizobium sp. NP1]|uniref:AraC family transcriptional regulator n=1 Tax=Bradyrhizobium sp. NP1 TaxID=3049772 RepID=UPI0033935CE0